MNIINLMPHAITLRFPSGQEMVIPPSGQVARVASIPGAVTLRSLTPSGVSIPVAGPTQYGDVEGIPAADEGTVYLVSALVLARVTRSDVFAPGTGPNDGAIRKDGQVVAVTRLIASV